MSEAAPSLKSSSIQLPGNNAVEKLRHSRQQLLDLTLRNKLLNFPQGDPEYRDKDKRAYKHLPVLARLDHVWRQLIEEDKGILIHTFPIDPDPEDVVAQLISGGNLCTRIDDDEQLEKRLLKLYREQETLESSTGDSAFFLALGFLEWFEAPPKDTKSYFSPLLLLHVRLVRHKPMYGGRKLFSLEMDGDRAQDNPCLHEKLRADHNIILPAYGEEDTPLNYLRAVEAAVSSKKTWQIHQSSALGFFNFARYRLWLDLNEKEWPESKAPGNHSIVQDLLDQKWRGDSSPMPDEDAVARQQQHNDLPVVVDADSTQYAALSAAARGQSLVIVGPPGSGKSQTITNLIAIAMSQGKRVLFVAQKTTALSVVQNRLKEIGLEPFCLSLHSNHAKPADAHQQLLTAGIARGVSMVKS